jgi:hypothetical protein
VAGIGMSIVKPLNVSCGQFIFPPEIVLHHTNAPIFLVASLIRLFHQLFFFFSHKFVGKTQVIKEKY